MHSGRSALARPFRLAPVLIAGALACLLSACDGAKEKPGAGPAKQGATGGAGLRMRTVSVKDSSAGNQVAFTLLVPSGWKYQAAVAWNGQLADLALISAQAEKRGGDARIQIYPLAGYLWLEKADLPFPEGSVYMGGILQRPIGDPLAYLRRFVLPAYRPGIGSDSVAAYDSLPALAESVWRGGYGSDRNTRVTAARISLRYDESGKAFEEVFHCVLSFTTHPKLPGSVIWRPELLYSIRDTAGGLRLHEPILMAVAGSLNVDRGWFAHYLGVRRKWVQDQMQSIRNAGEMSRYISMSNDEISTFIVSGYKAQHASRDRIGILYAETARRVETFTNPYSGNLVKLPAGYRKAWVSAGGEYLQSDAPGFDPNADAPGIWNPMERAQ